MLIGKSRGLATLLINPIYVNIPLSKLIQKFGHSILFLPVFLLLLQLNFQSAFEFNILLRN